MVTDGERREVAERLRHSWPKIADESAIGRIHRFYLAIYESVYADSGRHDFIELLVRLADLIDPGESVKCVAEVKVDGEQLEKLVHDAVVEYAGVDREALLELADEMDERAPYGWYSGERDSLRDYARRIREACGEAGR